MKISIRNDQRGLSPVIIVVAVVVLAAIGFGGWSLTQKDSVTKNATPAQKAVMSACEKAYKDKDLCKFTGAYDIEKLSYKIVITSTGESGGSFSMLSDGKGNNQLSGTNAGTAFDTITLDGITYMKDATDGQWMKFPPTDKTTAAAATESNPTSSIKFDTASVAATSYKKIGKEACGKLTCLKYQVVEKAKPGTTQFFWFDTKDFRMQRYASTDTKGTTDMVISYQKVTITAPSPTKDFSTGGVPPTDVTPAADTTQ